MSPTIGWNESNPPDTESAGLGDDRIRSLTTAIRTGLDGEHVWPSGGGDAGVHRQGSARAYVGTQSAVSSSGTDGKLMVTSDTSRLFHVGSGGTSYIGGPTVLSLGTYPGTVPQRSQWVEEVGVVLIPSGLTAQVSFPDSGYSGAPYVWVSIWTTGATQTHGVGGAIAVSPTGFIAQGPGFGTTSYIWRSLGTRAL